MCIGGRLWCCEGVGKQKKQKPLPLTGVIVNAKVIDFCAEVTIHQRYENVEDNSIEAVYEFPLMDSAAVSDFYAIVGGNKIKGVLQEKEKAKDAYDDAIASGKSAYMLEQVSDKKNTFKTSLGNLPPKSEVVVTIVYVTELAFSEKSLEFTIPTNTSAHPDGVVNPRFGQPAIKENSANIPYGLRVEISMDMSSKIDSVSASHPVQYLPGNSPSQAKVALANKDSGIPLTQDFELKIILAEPNKPVFRVQGDVGMLALYPNLTTDEDPITEMIFLVDRSGSMTGEKIEAAKDTLQIFLRSLPLGTLFNIVGFGTSHHALFKSSVEYDDNSLATATKHVQSIKADLGGTNLLTPLKVVLNEPTRQGIPRQLFILTDGETDNDNACISYVRQHANTTRVFAFGIHGANPKLVNGIAKAGEGKAELITSKESVEDKVISQLKRALQPALTNLRINWGDLGAEQAPFSLPPLFSGSRLIAYGYLSKDAKKSTVKFEADTASGPYSFEIEADPSQSVPGSFIPKLAARCLIRDLEEGRSVHHSAGKKPNGLEIKQKIVDLSIKTGMLSQFTAFLAINETSNKSVTATMKARNVNEIMDKGSGSSLTNTLASSLARRTSTITDSDGSDDDWSDGEAEEEEGESESESSSEEEMKEKKEKKSVKKKEAVPGWNSIAKKAPKLGSAAPPPAMSRTKSVPSSAPAAPPSYTPGSAKDIVMKQKAAGNFSIDSLASISKSVTVDKLRAAAPASLKSLSGTVLDEILVVLYICGYLQTKCAADKAQWELVEKKGYTWIKKELKKANVADTEDWQATAVKLYKAL